MSKQIRKDDEARLARAEELRRIVSQPSEKELAVAELAKIERELAEAREASAKAAAKDRLIGIRRAVGSVIASIDADEKRVREKAAELAEAIKKLNDRAGQVAALKAEADALCDRFALASVELPTVVPPLRRDIDLLPVRLADHPAVIFGVTESCEHQMRSRRTYVEVEGSDGYAIIQAAGLIPFPELTPRQRGIVAERQREESGNAKALAGMGETIADTERAIAAVGGGSFAGTLS